MQPKESNVYIFGRVYIGSSDSKIHHQKHCRPHLVPLGGEDNCFVQPLVVGVSASNHHVAIVTKAGDVYTWGSDFAGQLASGPAGAVADVHQQRKYSKEKCRIFPKVVKAGVYIRSLYSLRVEQVVCGGAHTVFRFNDGTVASCGCDTYNPFIPPRRNVAAKFIRVTCLSGWASSVKVKATILVKMYDVACGGRHTLLLDESGRLLAFGMGDNGRLGLGQNTNNIANPAEISALASVTVKSIACGWSSSMCVASSTVPGRSSAGLVYTWGEGESGRLGHGIDADQWSPKIVDELRRQNCHVTQCSMGTQHAAVRTGTGDVWVWGNGARGQLGLQEAVCTSLPCKMPLPFPPGSVKKVLCGAVHTVVLTSFGKVFVCGGSHCGQLGLDSVQHDVHSLTHVSLLPAFAYDVGVGAECTIVVTHAHERLADTDASSVCSDSCESEAPGQEAFGSSVSEHSGSVFTDAATAGRAGTPLPAVAECPLSACITYIRLGGDNITHYFAFRCQFGDLSPWTSCKRYSECLEFSKSIRTDPLAPEFPSKGILSEFFADKETKLEQRRQALQSWFDYYLEHSTSLGEHEKFLSFFEVGRQRDVQRGQGCVEARTGVAPDVTLHEGALRTDTTFITIDHSTSVAAADLEIQGYNVARSRSESSASLGMVAGERDGGGAGVTDSEDSTTQGGDSIMTTPQRQQRIYEEDDADISALMIATPDGSDSGLGTAIDGTSGSIALFQERGDGHVERSNGVAVVVRSYDSDRFNSGFNSGTSIATNSSRPRVFSGTPPHVRAVPVPTQPDVTISLFTAPRIIKTSFWCGLLGKNGATVPSSRTPSPQNVRGGASWSGADALLQMWDLSDFWLETIAKISPEVGWSKLRQKPDVLSNWHKGLPPYVRGMIWKQHIGNNLRIEKDSYQLHRGHARAVFHQVADASTVSCETTQPLPGSGSFRSPSPWFPHEVRCSSAQPSTMLDGVDSLTAKEQHSRMRRVSSSALLLCPEDEGDADSTDGFDWNSAAAAAAVETDAICSRLPVRITAMVKNVPRDVRRTLHDLHLFQENCPYERDLRDILGAFAFFRSEVGYVQSMSYIAAMFLIYCGTPFDAFVTFSNVIIRPFFQNYLKRREANKERRHYAFKQIFLNNLPTLYERFENTHIEVHLYLESWFTCMFAKCLVPRLVSRVWDLYLCDGAVVAYKVAIALLSVRGPGPNGVSACDIDEVVKRLTGMASRDESELFDRYKRVIISPELTMNIKQLEGELGELSDNE